VVEQARNLHRFWRFINRRIRFSPAAIIKKIDLYQAINFLQFSNKSTNQIHHSLRFIARRSNTAQHISGILMPIFRSLSTAVAASDLPLERGGSSAVGRGRSNDTATTTFQR
jgi:hypothetical protein